MRNMLTDKARKEIEEGFKLQQRAWEILDIIVSEWNSDPMSVQCFDLRLVNEAKAILAKRKQLDKTVPFGKVFNGN